jgi:hypothetical protein
MRHKGPFLTLLAGVAIAAVLFVLNSNLKVEPSASGGAQTPAGNAQVTNPEAKPPAAQPAPVKKNPATALNVTWAGRVVGGRATVAITAKGDKAIAYVCDGRRVESWMKGTATNGKLELTGAKNASLTGTYGNGRAKGTVIVGDERWTFDVGVVNKPSGLYRATARVRNAKIVGGWIVLADGTQVGVLTRDGEPRQAPPLDLIAGTASVDGTYVTVPPVDPAAGT